MKKFAKWIVAGVILAMAVSVISVCALDETQVDSQNISATAVTYDVGSYGFSGYYVAHDGDETFSVNRYKRTSIRSAANKAQSVTCYNNGWAAWCVMCVSDGEPATDFVVVDETGQKNTAEYYDTYGTKGYTDRLRIQGCHGSMDSGATIYNAHWCPDSYGIS